MPESTNSARRTRSHFRRTAKPALIGASLLAAAAGALLPAAARTIDTAGAAGQNPDLAVSCGIDVTLILDESGSIFDTAGAKAAVVEATQALVGGLVNTGSRVRVTEFANSARAVSLNGSSSFQVVDAGLETALSAYLNGSGLAQAASSYSPNGASEYNGLGERGTNWQEGLRRAAIGAGPGDLVVFLTDGRPNLWSLPAPGGGSGNGYDPNAVGPAAAQAAAIQAAGAHLLGVGVGEASTGNNFEVLSNLIEAGGGETWQSGPLDLRIVDSINVGADFGDLAPALTQVVFGLCSPSVSITKTDGSGAPIGQWPFVGSVDVAEASTYEWVSPEGLPVQTDGSDASQTVATAANGVALFQWAPGSVTQWVDSTSTFTWSEQLPLGWSVADQQVACNVERLNSDNSVSQLAANIVSAQVGSTVNFALVDAQQVPFILSRADIVTCTVQNVREASLTLVKQVENSNEGTSVPNDFVLTATGPDTLSGNGQVTGTVAAGTYALSESTVAGYYTQGFTCVGGTQAGQTVTLAQGDEVVCTIINRDSVVDLVLLKTDGGAEGIAGGDPFGYSFAIQNVGNRDASLSEPIVVVDVLPDGLSWVSYPDSCNLVAQTLSCSLDPALFAVGADPVLIDATVMAQASAPAGFYENVAWVDSAEDPMCLGVNCAPPPCPATSNNNVDCESTPVDRVGAIRILKTDDVASGAFVEPGDVFSYDLVVTNTGVSTILPGMEISDDLPDELELVSAVGAGWACNATDPVVCTYGPDLAPGANAPTVTVTVRVAADAQGDLIENTALVQAAIDRLCPDLEPVDPPFEDFQPACNGVSDTDPEETPLQVKVDLAIEKTSSVEIVGADSAFDWYLDVVNNGPGTALDVVVSDLVPDDVTVTAVASDDFECGFVGNQVTCTRTSMAPGATFRIVVTVATLADVEDGTIVNIGNVESGTPDSNLTNNTDDDPVDIVVQNPPPPTTQPPPPPVTLPATGTGSSGTLSGSALLLLAVGGLALFVSRRRSGRNEAIADR